MSRCTVGAAVVLATLTVAVSDSQAQEALGTFRWQLRPYCNMVTLVVRQDGPAYTLDGFDDQCGAATAASLVGTAFLNPDGSIGFGLTGAISPGAAPVVLYARLDLGSIGGPWNDSAGNSGTLVFTPGAGAPGLPPRQVPPNGIRPQSVTAGQIAPGAIGAVQIAAGSITSAQIALGSITGAHIAAGSITAAQLAPGAVQTPILGQCPVGQYLRGVAPSGAVICERFFVPNVSTTADDPTPNAVGQYTSIAVPADGQPVITHQDSTAGALRVTKCGNPACSAGNVSTNVDDPANNVGAYTSVTIGTDGLPVISYQDGTAGALKVLKCGNPTCTIGNVATTVDDSPTDSMGFYSSIAIGSDGLPVISHTHYYAGGIGLRVTHCGNAACSTGNTSTTADMPAGTSVGPWTAIAIGADGLPIISHRNETLAALRVTHCGNVTCTTGNVSTTVDDTANQIGYTTSIDIGLDGLAIISHLDNTAGDLRVTHCATLTCATGAVTTVADDSANSVGYYTSVKIGSDGRPLISHGDNTVATLRITQCGNAACSAGNVTTVVDDPVASVGLFSSMAIGVDGLPVISHLDGLALGLRVTKCASQGCR